MIPNQKCSLCTKLPEKLRSPWTCGYAGRERITTIDNLVSTVSSNHLQVLSRAILKGNLVFTQRTLSILVFYRFHPVPTDYFYIIGAITWLRQTTTQDPIQRVRFPPHGLFTETVRRAFPQNVTIPFGCPLTFPSSIERSERVI